MFKRAIKEEYKVPADINYLGEMRDFMTRIGRKYGVSERIINAFKLAIDEAGTNIIRHAYRDWDGFITIQVIVRDKSVTVNLIDQGHTFDPNNVRDPDLQRYVDIGKKGGLGIFIIRRVIDDIDYQKTLEGNELRLTKKREVTERRRFIFSDVSITMKTRFSLIASGILSSFVLAVFIWNYLQQDDKILEEKLSTGRAIARSTANTCLDFLAGEFPITEDLNAIAAKVRREYQPLVVDAIIVDTTGSIHTLRDNLLLTKFRLPGNAVEISPNIFLYSMRGIGQVFDIVEHAVAEVSGLPEQVGTIHLLINKSIIDTEIADSRKRALWISGIILVMGYMGVFILVYVTMSPFKKLSKWVQDLGRGEARDEIEFDASDEIGEIAQAFNEITEKFRKSQESLAEQERLQKEMQVAQEIQHTLLPAAFPEIEGYEIASYYEAAKEVGGDYFDFVEVDKDTLGIVVADVSGKGVPGSLVMTMIRTALRTEARGNKNAADVLARVNDFVINDMKRGMFVTVFYIILDSKNRIINYASAGHNPMILFRGNTRKSYYLNPRGFPIGINLPDSSLFRKSIQSDTLRLQEGDVLISYTDGITEAMNPQREKFGEERFLAAIREYGYLKVDPLVDEVRDEIKLFTQGYAQNDDITLVAIREKMKAEDVLFNLRIRLMQMVNEEGMSVKKACRSVGVSTSTYYKYKRRYEEMGEDGLKEKISRSDIEEKHISIEDKAKMYDIIREHPQYGAKRISEELNTEKYGFVELDERTIYEELVRSRLNTKELRTAFLEKGSVGRRMKPPGTPFLTLDGQVIVGARDADKPPAEEKLPAVPEEEEQESRFEMRVSQRSEEDALQEIGGETPEDLLESFLGLSKTVPVEEGQEIPPDQGEKHDESELDIKEIVSIPEAGERRSDGAGDEEDDQDRSEQSLDLVEEMDPDVLEGVASGTVEEEARIKDDESGEFEMSILDEMEEDESSAFEEEFDVDDVFDELISDVTDMNEEEKKETVESRPYATLDQILEINGDALVEGQESQIEEQITSSIAGDLVDAELSELEEIQPQHTIEYPGDEGFPGMTEGMDFEREAVPAGDGLEEAETVDEIDEEENHHLEIGLTYYQEGEYIKAVEEFQKALQERPDFIEACQCLGDTFFRMGQMDEAKNAYERVRRLDPDNISVLENLGVIFANRGDYKKAVWQWGEVLKRNPERRDIISRIKKMQRIIRQRYL